MSMEVESDLDSTVGIILGNEHPNRTGAEALSRFRGVVKLNGHKWGARISLKYKPYWLGTYHTEVEAAMAYDRAAIKLQRGDSSINFPLTCYTVEEGAFQSRYMNEEILEMIKDKTYSSRFEDFIAVQSLMMETEHSYTVNQREISCKMIFQKELVQGDFAKKKYFLIPKEYALEYFPLFVTADPGEAIESKFIDLTFYDKQCRSWTFRYLFWRSTRSFVFTRGWKHFVKMNNLSPGDTVIFYMGEYEVDAERRVVYMIDVHHNDSGIHVVDGNIEQEVDQGENIDNGVDVEGNGEEKNNGVMLFGLVIG